MDNLTHSLVGAVMGQAGLKKTTGLAMPALIIGANLPDVDAACFFWLEGTEHLAFRRGITHGPPALVLLPLVLAGILWGFDRWQERRGTRPEARLPVRFGWLYAMAFIGCLSHPFFDWLNVYGIRLLEPFSSQWFYGDTLFIIDPWLWAMLIASVWWSRRREKVAKTYRWPALLGIVAALGYIGANGWITARAVEDGQRAAQEASFLEHGHKVIASPLPLQFWKRETIYLDVAANSDDFFLQYRLGDWSLFGGLASEVTTPAQPCAWLLEFDEGKLGEQADAFLFWSRAPFATRAADGSVTLYDARFYDPRVRDRFSVALPQVKCEELTPP
jgi:inner membrane protein